MTGGKGFRYDQDPLHTGLEDAINDCGPDAKMEEAVIPAPAPTPVHITIPQITWVDKM